MKHGVSIVAVLAAIGAAAVVFHVKGTVREVERELARTERAIEEARWRLQTLKADHAFLSRPERLALQAEQLGLVPATSARLVSPSAIPLALPAMAVAEERVVQVLLPSGERLELRFRPTAGALAGLAAARPVADAIGATR